MYEDLDSSLSARVVLDVGKVVNKGHQLKKNLSF